MSRFCTLCVGLVLLTSASGATFPDSPQLKVPKELLQKRVDAARKVFEQNLVRLKEAQGLPSELFGWSERWLEAELALAETPDARAKALREHLDRTREVERTTVNYAKIGQGRQTDADAATYYRLEAETRLFKEGVEPHPAKGTKAKADSDMVNDRKPTQQRRDAPPKVEAGIKELLKGSWALVEVERSGKKTHVGSTGTSTLNSLTMAFDGAKFHITYPGESVEVSGTYTLVAQQKTADLDLFVSRDTTGSQVGEGRTDKYLCQFEGDTLKLASYGLGYPRRPKSFDDTHMSILWLQRQGKQAETSATK
jgi:uncharacterized protein (TIGR03067 family)